MKKFSYEFETDEDNITTLHMRGFLDAGSQLPDLDAHPDKAVRIDLGELNLINSTGMRLWLLWVGKFNHKQFLFLRIPSFIVDQLQIVEGFFPKNAQYLSFFVPYFCTDCNDENSLLYIQGKDYFPTGLVKELIPVMCTECSIPKEPSIHIDRYFRALQLTPPVK